MTTLGINIVWGVPAIIPHIIGAPEGSRIKLRLRNNEFGMAFVFEADGKVTKYAMLDHVDYWEIHPDLKQGINWPIST